LLTKPLQVDMLLDDGWSRSYSRERAAYPVASLRR